jgi:two-component system sensor histidine kinase DesK
MTGMLTAWRRQTDPQRVDTYTRWTLYLLLASGPLVALSIGVGVPSPAAEAYVVLTAAQTIAAMGVVRSGLARLVTGSPLSRRWLVTLAGATVAAVVVAVLALPLQADDDRSVRALALLLALTVAVLAVSLTLGSRTLLGCAAAVGAVVAVTEVAADNPAAWVVGGLSTLIVWGMALSFRISGWMLGVVWEQERSRTVHARLAVAEERLRFSRDLHDVVGRTLSAIAVKSELAAELSRRGQDGAVAQMLEVRELAQDSLREVRGVVSGLRTADLAAELTGARSVLRSAGIDTRVIGEDARLPPDVQQALAWVVREAVTNVVRHAHARRCTIDLDVLAPHGTGAGLPAQARLTVTNDGVPGRRGRSEPTRPAADAGPVPRGSGLLGLRERLAEVGGELATSADGDHFTLCATVPLAPTAADTMGSR